MADLARSLRAVEDLCERWESARPSAEEEMLPSVELRAAASRVTRQLDWLRQAEGEDRWLRQRHPEQIKLITDVQLLVLAALEFERVAVGMAPSENLPAEVLERLHHVREECARIHGALEHLRPPEPRGAENPSAQAASATPDTTPLTLALAALERSVARFPDTLAFLGTIHESASKPPSREPIATRPFFTPAFRIDNVEILQFALKVSLAASLCGLLYQALDWPGIGTCVMTAVIVAQSTFGAGLHKGALRFLGAALAGLVALFVVAVLMPNMDGLASLLVVTAILTFASGWIATGSTRIAYVGVQMGITLYLVLFNTLGPDVALVPARDRLIGVLVGIVVMGVIDCTIWPVFTRTALRVKLAGLLRDMARLHRLAVSGEEGKMQEQAFGIHRGVAEALALQEELIFEPTASAADADLERRIVLRVLNRLQKVFLDVLGATRKRSVLQRHPLPASALVAMQRVDEQITAALESLAGSMEAQSAPPRLDMEDALANYERTVRAGPPDADLQPLQGFDTLARRLVDSLTGLEADIRAALAGPTFLSGPPNAESPSAARSPAVSST